MSAQSSKSAIYANWRDKVVFAADGPKPQFLLDSPKFKVVLVGLEAGQKLPTHPAPEAVYHVLEGSGTMLVGGERIAVEAGVIVVVAAGVPRGFEAKTRLAFMGSRGADE
jgi:quercetin dioxygenase-like cupin family protein